MFNFCILLDRGGAKEAQLELRHAFDLATFKTFGLVNPVFFSSNWFFECEHPSIDTEHSTLEP